MQVAGPDGARTVDVVDLHRLPGDQPERDTVLDHGELITSVDLPPPLDGGRSTYRKVRDRSSFAFALVSVAALVTVEDGAFADARIAFGGLAHEPWRARLAEQVLIGAPATEDTFRRAGEAELADARPLRDNGFKVGTAVRTLAAVLRGLCR